MGLPVITTNVPGCRETIKDGFNGFVKDKDAKGLAAAMEKFLKKNLINSMGSKSRELAISKFDVNKVVEVIIDELGVSVSKWLIFIIILFVIISYIFVQRNCCKRNNLDIHDEKAFIQYQSQEMVPQLF